MSAASARIRRTRTSRRQATRPPTEQRGPRIHRAVDRAAGSAGTKGTSGRSCRHRRCDRRHRASRPSEVRDSHLPQAAPPRPHLSQLRHSRGATRSQGTLADRYAVMHPVNGYVRRGASSDPTRGLDPGVTSSAPTTYARARHNGRPQGLTAHLVGEPPEIRE